MGETGGEDQVTLTGTQIGNHYHYWGRSTLGVVGIRSSDRNWDALSFNVLFPPLNTSEFFISTSSDDGFNIFSRPIRFSGSWPMSYITSLAVGTAAQEAHENRPPYYALYYIMKLE